MSLCYSMVPSFLCGEVGWGLVLERAQNDACHFYILRWAGMKQASPFAPLRSQQGNLEVSGGCDLHP